MKIIDEKGKLFKKINIIDLIIVLFLTCFITPIFYFSYKVTTQPKVIKQETMQKAPHRYVEVHGILFVSNPEVIKEINKGDKELDSKKNIIAEIIDIGKPEKILREISIGKESLIIEDTALNLKFRLLTKIQNNHLVFKSSELLAEETFEFNTPKYKINVVFIGEEKKAQEKKEKVISKTNYKQIKLRVVASQILPEVAELISIGDKEYVAGTTKHDQIFILGEIGSIKNISLYKFVSIEDGKKRVIERTDLRNAELVLNLKVEERNNLLIYNKIYTIKIGGIVKFQTPQYDLNCQILEILK